MSLEPAAYPSDVSDEECALVAPYLALLRESSGQRDHALREVFNGLRSIVRTGAPWRFMPHDLPPWAAVYQQTKRRLSAECFADVAVDTPGQVVALHGTPADVGDGDEAGRLSAAVQAETEGYVEKGFVDQGYTGAKPAAAARAHGIDLEVVKAPEAKRGFVLVPRRWVAGRSFTWAARCRRLVKDDDRYGSTLAGLHMVAFVCLMLRQAERLLSSS